LLLALPRDRLRARGQYRHGGSGAGRAGVGEREASPGGAAGGAGDGDPEARLTGMAPGRRPAGRGPAQGQGRRERAAAQRVLSRPVPPPDHALFTAIVGRPRYGGRHLLSGVSGPMLRSIIRAVAFTAVLSTAPF